MGKVEELIKKATESPQNLKFSEFQKLCEYYGLTLRNVSGSHHLYKRVESPKFTLSIQNKGGKAVPYQVKQLFDHLKRCRLWEGEDD